MKSLKPLFQSYVVLFGIPALIVILNFSSIFRTPAGLPEDVNKICSRLEGSDLKSTCFSKIHEDAQILTSLSECYSKPSDNEFTQCYRNLVTH